MWQHKKTIICLVKESRNYGKLFKDTKRGIGAIYRKQSM